MNFLREWVRTRPAGPVVWHWARRAAITLLDLGLYAAFTHRHVACDAATLILAAVCQRDKNGGTGNVEGGGSK